MKNIFAFSIFILTIFFGCKDRNSDGEILANASKLKTDSVKFSSENIKVGDAVEVKTFSQMKSGCETFLKFNYKTDGNIREITPEKIMNNSTCGEEKTVVSSFNFSPKSAGTYTFKFWTGDNSWLEKQFTVK